MFLGIRLKWDRVDRAGISLTLTVDRVHASSCGNHKENYGRSRMVRLRTRKTSGLEGFSFPRILFSVRTKREACKLVKMIGHSIEPGVAVKYR